MKFLAAMLLTVVTARICLADRESMSDDQIRALGQDVALNKRAVGVVIGVLDEKGPRVFAFGKTAKENGKDVDGDTVFEIGSITKTFTCTLLADLVTRRAVNLDDRISKFTPPGEKTPMRNGKQITLVDLATQSSGLPRMMSNFDPKDPENPYADYTAEKLWAYLSTCTLERDIGQKYEYSNLGMGLLGTLLARRVGTNYEALLTARILRPLGMNSTAIKLTPELKARFAQGYDATLQPANAWDFDAMAGCGGIRSSVNDMLKYLAANMGVAKSDLWPAMELAQEPIRPTTIPETRIGLAWHVTDRAGTRIIWHNGETGGYHSCLAFDPTNKIGAVVLANSSSSIDDIAMLLAGEPKSAPPAPTTGQTAIHLDPTKLQRFVGKYELSPGEEFNLRVEDGRLMAQLTGQDYYEIFPTSETNFFYKIVEAQISFNCDASGNVKSLTLHQNGANQEAPRISDDASPMRRNVAVDPKLFDGYAGTYTLASGAVFTIRRDDDRLLAKLTGQAFYQIFPESETNFFYKIVDAQISFVKDNHGKTTALVLHQNGIDQTAIRSP